MDRWLDRINPQLHTVWHGGWRQGILEAPRVLADHELVLVSAGRCMVDVGDERIECRGPYYLIVPPRRRHLTIATTDTFRYCAHFDWEVQRQRPPEPMYHFCPDEPPAGEVRAAPAWVPAALMHGTVDAGSPVIPLAQSLAARWHEPDGPGQASCRALLLEILLRLLSGRTARTAMARQRDRRSALAMEIKNRLDFMELGSGGVQQQLRPLGYRHEHLCRVFRQAYGIPPLRYWENARLEKAKQLLVRDGATVGQVAAELGFHDATHFCRSFRRFTGTTPRRFARQRA